ncbi:UDP-N-acetylmuramoyl-L-alanine--D-glutamate ligase [Candidatus Peregrinibacteria bacterium]|nr:UDP-N-acetylmuramoyl-L-alanine--D-glutamate ligase [Candidatus Peregrinibacteria bacterium]
MKYLKNRFPIGSGRQGDLPVENDKKILILGFGKDGAATLRVLRRFFPKQTLWIADKKADLRVRDSHVRLILGENYLKNLDRFDVIIKSPGIPFLPEISRVAKRVTSSAQLFFDHLSPSNAVIGVTGSKGKSTVAALLHAVLKHAGLKTRLIGNIGKPALPFLNHKNTVFVYELSSYQLERLHARPHIAIFTQFFPEHLNYHGSLARYFSAKKNITKYQKKEDFFIFPHSVNILRRLPTKAQKIACGVRESFWHDEEYFYHVKKKLFPVSDVKLLGEHNLQNILLVLAAVDKLHIPLQKAAEVITSFSGLPHRLEYVGNFRGIDFYDDAISTTPESTLAALDIFKEKIGTIILGGEDRGYDFSELAEALCRYRIVNIVLFPDTGERIRVKIEKILVKNSFVPRFLETRSMKEAVRFAYQHTPKGMVCLLSTASPSYSLFKNCEEKGGLFWRYVQSGGKI